MTKPGPKTGEHRRPLADRFWEKVRKTAGCWLWTGGKNSDGYGTIGAGGRYAPVLGAHRVAWMLEHGEEPDGHVLHSCDNRACVNPTHLFLGSHQDNMADCRRKGRKARLAGEGNPSAKLTAAEVREIRGRYRDGDTQRGLAGEYGVAKSTIGRIVRETHWRDA